MESKKTEEGKRNYYIFYIYNHKHEKLKIKTNAEDKVGEFK